VGEAGETDRGGVEAGSIGSGRHSERRIGSDIWVDVSFRSSVTGGRWRERARNDEPV